MSHHTLSGIDNNLDNTLERVKNTEKSCTVIKISDPALAPLVASARDGKFIYITPDVRSVERIEAALNGLGVTTISVTSVPDLPIYSQTKSHTDAQFLSAISRFRGGEGRALIIPAPALLVKIPQGSGESLDIKTSDEMPQKDIISSLEKLGYTRAETLQDRGTYCRRGDIIDYFPDDGDAIRITQWGNAIERITTIDTSTLLSKEKLKNATIYPIVQISNLSKDVLFRKLGEINSHHENTRSIITSIKSRAEKGEDVGGTRWILPFLCEFDSVIAGMRDVLGHDGAVILDRPREISNIMTANEKQNNTRMAGVLEGGLLLPKHHTMLATANEIIGDIKKLRTIAITSDAGTLGPIIDKTAASEKVTLSTLPATNFFGALGSLTPEIVRVRDSGKTVVVFVGNSPALANYLSDRNILYNVTETITNIKKSEINLLKKSIPVSFELLSSKTVFFSVNTPGPIATPPPQSFSPSKKQTFTIPQIGEVVVHELHGLGRYMGIKKLELGSTARDYIVLQYDGGAFVYLPPEQTALLSNYNGEPSRLNKLGGQDFANAKQRVRRRLKELSFKLAELYAKRRDARGVIYDCPQEHVDAFTNAFPYPHTEDQKRAINDIENDMQHDVASSTVNYSSLSGDFHSVSERGHGGERPKFRGEFNSEHLLNTSNPILGGASRSPMDRLVCGDVGYGKTEVALHAAFRAVMSGFQVMFLCPTTILSVQHFQTSKKRLEPFGIRVEALNRFTTDTEAKKIIDDTTAGKVDVLIGTHRLLSKDVIFKRLSLVILDEEQRFGVGHKEQIKRFKVGIDVLTLSATPIPRTLNMAMVGIRDISNIATPPANRHPVVTYVTEYSKELAADAIMRELDRGGQAIVLHNKVETIEAFAGGLRATLKEHTDSMGLSEQITPPHISIGVVHGQMSPVQMENVIASVYSGKINVLVASTIIENGIDITMANTIIVTNSQNLGTAQMHQIRGRVGRGTKQAYAYFTYPANMVVTETAQQRLTAIQSNAGIGAGMQIAMRDLGLRGSGDLLGASQSGHIEQIGFDTYTKILDSVVRKAKRDSSAETRNSISRHPSLAETQNSPLISKGCTPKADGVCEKNSIYQIARMNTLHNATSSSAKSNTLNDGDDEFEDEVTPEVVLDIKLDAFIPHTYIPNEAERMKIYRAVSEISARRDCDVILSNLKDLYGAPPPPTKHIVLLGYIRHLALRYKKDKGGVRVIKLGGGTCSISYNNGTRETVLPATVANLIKLLEN